MPINFKFTYVRKGKHIFVPNDDCVRHGKVLVRYCSKNVDFPSYFFHYQAGGHVAALHQHLKNKFFFRIDLQNFFYLISRRRVAEALHKIGFIGARDYAKWSCVKNPYAQPPYALPIGFIQSPALSSLVMLRCPIVAAIEKAKQEGVFISVYFDDLIGSSLDPKTLTKVFEEILGSCEKADLVCNTKKLTKPADKIEAFNCDLSHGVVEVTEKRLKEFFDVPHTAAAADAFEEYCRRVARENKAVA